MFNYCGGLVCLTDWSSVSQSCWRAHFLSWTAGWLVSASPTPPPGNHLSVRSSYIDDLFYFILEVFKDISVPSVTIIKTFNTSAVVRWLCSQTQGRWHQTNIVVTQQDLELFRLCHWFTQLNTNRNSGFWAIIWYFGNTTVVVWYSWVILFN